MKKGLIKSVAVLFAAFSLGGVVVPPLTAHAEVLERMQGDRGEWRRDEHGWYFMLSGTTKYVADNWLYDNQKWYYFDHWGYMYRNAWINYKGDSYYVDVHDDNEITYKFTDIYNNSYWTPVLKSK